MLSNPETRLGSILPIIPRESDGSIDYCALGASLESDCCAAELAAFARKFKSSTDGAMASLACYASFLCDAKVQRLAGFIDNALRAERNADTVYSTDILPANRW